jgi:hypothetical protein
MQHHTDNNDHLKADTDSEKHIDEHLETTDGQSCID